MFEFLLAISSCLSRYLLLLNEEKTKFLLVPRGVLFPLPPPWYLIQPRGLRSFKKGDQICWGEEDLRGGREERGSRDAKVGFSPLLLRFKNILNKIKLFSFVFKRIIIFFIDVYLILLFSPKSSLLKLSGIICTHYILQVLVVYCTCINFIWGIRKDPKRSVLHLVKNQI